MKRRAFLAAAVGVMAGCTSRPEANGTSSITTAPSQTSQVGNSGGQSSSSSTNATVYYPVNHTSSSTTPYSTTRCQPQHNPADRTVKPPSSAPPVKSSDAADEYWNPIYIINDDSKSHTVHLKNTYMPYDAYITVCPHSREKTKFIMNWNSRTTISTGNQTLKEWPNGRKRNAYVIITSDGNLTFKSVRHE